MKNFKSNSIILAKKIARERQPYCSKCGKPRSEGKLDAHHIIPVGYARTASDLDNLMVLCVGCHTMGANAAHQNILKFADWFNGEYPGRKDVLWDRAWSYSQNPFPKIDWQAEYERLKALTAETQEV